LDYYTILAQRIHIEREFAGKRIETVRLHEKKLFLGFECESALKLACVPDMPYILTIPQRFIPLKKSHTWYSSQFDGCILEKLSMIHGDRILIFHLDSGNRLVFEMTGRHANLILVDEENIISGALRVITPKESGFREVRPGVRYTPPPARQFPDPLWAPLPLLERSLKESESSITEALASRVCAGSRLFAQEAVARAEIDPEIPSIHISSDNVFCILKIVAQMTESIEKGGGGGTIVRGADGLPRDVFPLKMVSAGPRDLHIEDLNEVIELYAKKRETGLEKRSLTKFVSGTLTREERSLRATMKKIERERGTSTEPELLEHRGNTILANLRLIHRGMSSVTMPDPYSSGEIEIELNPALDGPANAERMFARARKLRSASRIAEERLSAISSRLEEIKAEHDHLAKIETVRELKTIAARYERHRSKERGVDTDQPFPRRFVSVSGLEIIVGRNNNENDALVRWAHKDDIWLHAQGVGGSHVILRTHGKKQSPDRKSIEQASAIAAYYSKAKTSAVVPVAYTPVKYVVKRKGQGPGQVTYTREKVVFVEPGLP